MDQATSAPPVSGEAGLVATRPDLRPELPPIVGRTAEIERVRSALASGQRVVTLTGPGGVGKTRIALEVAALTGSDVLVVPLSAVNDAGEALAAIARVAGWELRDDQPAADQLGAAVGDAPLLVVLDTAEHLPGIGEQVELLVDAGPSVSVLATSRSPLHTTAERLVEVAPMPVPDGALPTEAVLDVEAVRLLVQAARRHVPDFAVGGDDVGAIAEICRRVDGLPLAIELAAARLRLLTPDQLLGLFDRRLDVLGSRARGDHHGTMRAAIEWSLRLLEPDDRWRFVALGVFPGPFDAMAAAEVLGVDVVALLDTLETLVEHHLVREVGSPASGRRQLLLLDMLREYALDEIAQTGREDDLRSAHAAWCLRLVEDAAPHLDGADSAATHELIDATYDDIRAALTWLLDRGANEVGRDLALRMVSSLWRYWWIRGRAVEGAEWIDRSLDGAVGQASPAVARAWHAGGELAEQRGDLDDSARRFERAATIWSELGDEVGAAEAWNGLGMVARTRGDLVAARWYHERAADIFARAGLRRREATTLHHLAAVAYFGNDLALAAELWTDTLAILAEVGDDRARGLIVSNLGSVQLALGDVDGAIAAFDEATDIGDRYDDRYGRLHGLVNGADARIVADRLEEAEALLATATVVAEEVGNPYAEAVIDLHRGRMAWRHGELGDAAARLATSWRRLVDLDISSCRAAGLEHLAMIAAEVGDHESAASFFAAADLVRENEGTEPPGPEAELIRTWRDKVESAMAGAIEGSDRQAPDRQAPATAQVVDRFVRAVRGVRRQPVRSRFDPDVVAQFGLTAREAEVAELLVERLTDQEIADRLYLSRRTVTSHVSAILRKLGVPSRRNVAEALAPAPRS